MTEKVLLCPMCRGPRSKELFRSEKGYPIVRCLDCRLVFTDARTAPPADQLYPHFEQSENAGQRSARTALSVFSLQRAGVVENAAPKGRLLDFGAGSGAFARFMAGRGHEVVGLEPYSLGKTVEESNLQLVRAPLDKAKKSLGTFDCITMWHVLEHIDEPMPVLATLRSMLNPGGRLIVSVPNFASWQSNVFQGSWFHLDPPRHVLQFEPETLDACLSRAGFQVFKSVPFLPEYGTSGWIQSALNRVLPHRNFLYEWVKDRGALAKLGTFEMAGHFAASVAGGAPILAAAVPVEFCASLVNKSAALTVVAGARQ
jgi:SAM-dependent methyltransferase